MNKIAISLFALAAISTASFAASAYDGSDRDPSWIANDYNSNAMPVVKKFITTEALSTGVKTKQMDADFYLNKSQLR